MRVVIALGGNALLERGERPEADVQRRNTRRAAKAVARVAAEHEVVLTRPISLRHQSVRSGHPSGRRTVALLRSVLGRLGPCFAGSFDRSGNDIAL